MFLQIQEPKSSEPKALGIDLGTTHSLVAVSEHGKTQVLKEHGKVLLPSVVHFKDNGSSVVGTKALEQLNQAPLDTIASFKRYMGKSLKDVQETHVGHELTEFDNQLAFKTKAGDKTPIELSAQVLKSLYNRAQNHVTGHIKGAVITVPAYFDEAARIATKQAAQLAGINVLRLINEPTAAAIAYGLQEHANGLCLVFDLGGGTFDVTLLKIDNGVFHVLATGGDTELGGDDMDALIADWLLQGELNPKAKMVAKVWAKYAKEALTSQEEVTQLWQDKAITMTQQTLNGLIEPVIERCITLTRKVLEDANISIDDVKDIILVGGSTKVPFLQAKLRAAFGKELLCSLDPEQVVVQGAASHGASLLGAQEKKSLLIDVIPLSLGIETMGGVVEKVLMRNTPIPAQAKQTFTTYENNQTGMIFHIVQGERELAKDNRSLAQFVLKKLPNLPKGHAKVEVTFGVNEEGLLHVSAKELTTGEHAEIDVSPSFGLSDETITQMLAQALESADDDVKARTLETKRLDGQQLLKAIEQALKQDGTLLAQKELTEIQHALGNLREKLQEDNEQDINLAIKRLESASDDFMRKRLDNTLKSMVKGKSLNQINDVLCRK